MHKLAVKHIAPRAGDQTVPAPRDFPPVMRLGDFLFEYLHRCGARHCFGIPGDFVLPTFAALERSKIKSVTMTHEPSAGFAADACSRATGLGVVCVTYCVGGLNVLNAIAGAYAEKAPVVVISGAPGLQDREKDPLVHHKVKTFETQRRVYDEVTVASAVLLDEKTAAEEIVRCVQACLRQKRPIYIEVPHDMVDREIPICLPEQPHSPVSDPETLAAVVRETLALIENAKRPIILAGVELARYRLAPLAVRIAEQNNIPIATDLLSKSAVPENHPLYIGVYGGALSTNDEVRRQVESADLVLMLGTFITDMSMGFYTAKLDRQRIVLATTERINIKHHHYEGVQFRDFLTALTRTKAKPKQLSISPRNGLPAPLREKELSDPLTMPDVFRILSLHIDEHCCVVADVGDAMFGAVAIRSARQAQFIGPAYYMSMGYAVPASIGVALGRPDLRPYVLVGDGAFQMTGVEISTAVRLGLNPIILILNNDGYGTMRKIRDGAFNGITQWNYSRIGELVGSGPGRLVSTKAELNNALNEARAAKTVQVIEIQVPRDNVSEQLARVAREVRHRRGIK